MSGVEYYDRDGNPLTIQGYLNYTEGASKKHVARTEVGNSNVSTVWLGLNHQYGDGPLLIFETMIFGGPLDQDTWRYSTEAQAVDGHAHAVWLAKAAQAAMFRETV